VMQSPGKMSVSKYTMEEVPATQASGSFWGTRSGATRAVTPEEVRRALHTSL
jgi:hypothetical protein